VENATKTTHIWTKEAGNCLYWFSYMSFVLKLLTLVWVPYTFNINSGCRNTWYGARPRLHAKVVKWGERLLITWCSYPKYV